jgi:hypothetical protein
LIVAAAAALVSGGCGSAGRPWPNVGTYTFLSGEFCGSIAAPLDKVVPAAEAALRDRGVAARLRGDAKVATLRGKDGAGRDVLVRIRAEGAPGQAASRAQCWLCIVIGTVGDEGESAAVFRAIREKLE